ncbi:MAG: hypothetical protein HKN21_06690 [Candidatus Eisenbacteria bacterium]|uniref:Uncharacterized protein n=1 Tax=Eiseniibacteriota bacterium TaxID=2212470 RepID=A0A7Y2E853_UNCEI|nr:hypothetical protein [Candidatus Eisenbacteria bacterium]
MPYPVVEPWDLANFYRRLKATVLELENCWESGDLNQALANPEFETALGSRVLDVYKTLAESPATKKSPFRRNSIHAILEPLKEVLEEPKTNHMASVSSPPAQAERGMQPPSQGEGSEWIHGLDVQTPTGTHHLRLHQVIGSRFWGIGFETETEETNHWLVNALVRVALRRLAGDLRGLGTIEARLAKKTRMRTEPKILPDHEGRRFEQLMLDLLNQEQYSARRASLIEDFLEKTDMRVHYPDVKRRKGARVQVTQTLHQASLERKLSKIRNVEEFIILSPRSLADALSGAEGERLLNRSELNQLWECLPMAPATIEDLAQLLKEHLLQSIPKALQHPQGPAAFIAPPVRLLVQRYVYHEALRSTEKLRDREAQEKRPPTS